MFEHLDNTEKAEKAFLEARECLAGCPALLKQFDEIYLREGRPASAVVEGFREVLKLKAEMAASGFGVLEGKASEDSVVSEGAGGGNLDISV